MELSPLNLFRMGGTKKKYKYYVTNGMCPTCKSRKRLENVVLCEYCYNKRQSPESKAKQRELVNRYKEKNRQLGLCDRCKNPRVEGRTECEACIQRKKEYKIKRRQQVFSLYGSKCACCGAQKNDRKYIDFGADLDPDPNFVYVVYLCSYCVDEAAKLLSPPSPPTTVVLEFKEVLEKLNAINATIRHYCDSVNNSSNISAKDSDVPTQSTEGFDKSSSGRRSKGVPSLEQLIREPKGSS